MKRFVLALGVALILPFAAQAQSRDLAWVDQARAAVSAAVSADPDAGSTRLRAEPDRHGRLTNVTVIRSSGSLDQDRAAVAAAKAARLDSPPLTLEGRRVQFEVGRAPAQVAATR